jgi:hypothetical protein
MRSQVDIGQQVRFRMQMHAKVVGLGRAADVTLTEERAYDRTSGNMFDLHFRQAASTGTVKVDGRVDGNILKIQVHAGEQVSEQQVALEDDLPDQLAPFILAASGKVGDTSTSMHLDPSILKQVQVNHRVVSVERQVFAGVEVEAVLVESHYPELGVTEQQWLGRNGMVFESRIGGFFVARIEPEEEAKRPEYSQDLLVSAVVKPPIDMRNASGKPRIRLTFEGFGDLVPEASARQEVRQGAGRTKLTLTRDPPPAGPLRAVVNADTEPTPFIQSQHPAIIAAARRAIGDAQDLATANARLTHFVFDHVHDEYVPAYSNALEALQSGRGDCTEHSVLFVALARALGIPARVAVGIAYWPAGSGFGWHAWSEVHDGQHWIAVDPTWDQPVADVTHVKLADGGPANQARIVMLLGKLKLVDVVM